MANVAIFCKKLHCRNNINIKKDRAFWALSFLMYQSILFVPASGITTFGLNVAASSGVIVA